MVPGMAKTDNRLKKSKHKKGTYSKSKTNSPTTPATPDPLSPTSTDLIPPSSCPSPTVSDELRINPMLYKAESITQSTVLVKPKVSKICINEYYPHKLKRPSMKKKTVLKHNNLKEICKRSKRKSTMPHKGKLVEYKDPQTVEYNELTMTEIVRLMEDTDKLDDDDLMEILTCPSPVWWEDPPDEGYCEDPIDKVLVKEAVEGICESPPPLEEDVHIRVQLLNRQNKNNEKLIKKKNKLEHILGNLKSKIISVKEDNKNEIAEDRNDEILTKNDGEVQCGSNNNEDIHNTPIDNEITNIKDDNINHNNEINHSNVFITDNIKERDSASSCRLSDSSDGDILSDISVNEDELLKHLEEIEIPIKNSTPVKNKIKDAEILKDVPKTMPPLLKFPYQSVSQQPLKFFKESSKSISLTESSKEKSSDDAMSGEFDSISDTNVRFLDDEDVEMLSRTDPIAEETAKDKIDDDIDNNRTSLSINKAVESTSSSTSSPDKSEQKSKPHRNKKEGRKVYKKIRRDTTPKHAKMIAFLNKHNKVPNGIDNRRRIDNSYSIPKVNNREANILHKDLNNRRKLNQCVCGKITCIHCFSNTNHMFRTINISSVKKKNFAYR